MSEIPTYPDEQTEYQRGFEAGRASRDAEAEKLRADLEKAQANYRFMVERAADQKLDGYRELGARLASSEQSRDELRAQLAEKDAQLDRILAALYAKGIVVSDNGGGTTVEFLSTPRGETDGQ